jgi:TrkA domain protein
VEVQVEVEQTPLPGVGIRYDFATASGRRLGLLVHRDERVDLVVYAEDDPDSVDESVTLLPQERAVLVELLALPPGDNDPDSRTHHRTWQLSEDLP